ncbi:MAG: NAD(P)/FAD-dependent oxidoreductase [Candidatus Sumerlaeia bacterium]
MDYMFDITIIGGGVVGLAIAAALADDSREICLLEKYDSFGRETSSRNSEVVHSGLYYKPGSLKANLCLKGQQMLFDICSEYPVPVRKVGKLVVACVEEEIPTMERILKNAEESGATGMQVFDAEAIAKLEPHVKAVAAIWCPKTAIIDSHQLMRHFEQQASNGGAILSYNSEVKTIEKLARGYRVIFDEKGEENELTTRILINSAGLGCENIARLTGIDTTAAGYTLHPCKGEYFAVTGTGGKTVSRLIYPLPPADGRSVGLHVTPDMQGRIRLGPSAEYVDTLNYDVNPEHRGFFFQEASRYLPFVTEEGLMPDMAGIRPKLMRPGDLFRDFVIRNEADKGHPDLVNLIGIESPGLTASPAIAEMVRDIIKEMDA